MKRRFGFQQSKSKDPGGGQQNKARRTHGEGGGRQQNWGGEGGPWGGHHAWGANGGGFGFWDQPYPGLGPAAAGFSVGGSNDYAVDGPSYEVNFQPMGGGFQSAFQDQFTRVQQRPSPPAQQHRQRPFGGAAGIPNGRPPAPGPSSSAAAPSSSDSEEVMVVGGSKKKESAGSGDLEYEEEPILSAVFQVPYDDNEGDEEEVEVLAEVSAGARVDADLQLRDPLLPSDRRIKALESLHQRFADNNKVWRKSDIPYWKTTRINSELYRMVTFLVFFLGTRKKFIRRPTRTQQGTVGVLPAKPAVPAHLPPQGGPVAVDRPRPPLAVARPEDPGVRLHPQRPGLGLLRHGRVRVLRRRPGFGRGEVRRKEQEVKGRRRVPRGGEEAATEEEGGERGHPAHPGERLDTKVLQHRRRPGS